MNKHHSSQLQTTMNIIMSLEGQRALATSGRAPLIVALLIANRALKCLEIERRSIVHQCSADSSVVDRKSGAKRS